MQKIPPKGGAAQFCIKKEKDSRLFAAENPSLFYFLRILRLIHLKRFVARSFEEAVAALCGEVIPFSVDQFPSFYGAAVCVNVVSLLGVVCIAVRVQGNPFAFGPAVFVFDVELPALISLGPNGGYLLFHFFEEFGFLGEIIIELDRKSVV